MLPPALVVLNHMMLQFNIQKQLSSQLTTVCTNHDESFWEKMTPIWDYFEFNDVNLDEATVAFSLSSLKTMCWEIH